MQAPEAASSPDGDPMIPLNIPAEPISAEPPQLDASSTADEEREAIEGEPPAEQVEPTAIEGNGQSHGPNLEGAKPRRSGRIALDINLGGDGHTWERVTTPDDQQLFRFKDAPTDEQMDLIHRYGFQFDAERKEAFRPNDATGRIQADRLAWYLRELQHAEGASLAV